MSKAATGQGTESEKSNEPPAKKRGRGRPRKAPITEGRTPERDLVAQGERGDRILEQRAPEVAQESPPEVVSTDEGPSNRSPPSAVPEPRLGNAGRIPRRGRGRPRKNPKSSKPVTDSHEGGQVSGSRGESVGSGEASGEINPDIKEPAEPENPDQGQSGPDSSPLEQNSSPVPVEGQGAGLAPDHETGVSPPTVESESRASGRYNLRATVTAPDRLGY